MRLGRVLSAGQMTLNFRSREKVSEFEPSGADLRHWHLYGMVHALVLQ